MKRKYLIVQEDDQATLCVLKSFTTLNMARQYMEQLAKAIPPRNLKAYYIAPCVWAYEPRTVVSFKHHTTEVDYE